METFWYWLTQVHLEKWSLKLKRLIKSAAEGSDDWRLMWLSLVVLADLDHPG